MKYVKPSLEELELFIEGSFLNTDSHGGTINPNPGEGEGEDD